MASETADPAKAAFELVADRLGDHHTAWSLGTFGAIAEFMRDEGEPWNMTHGDGQVACWTGRGALRFEEHQQLSAIAYETPSQNPRSWSHAVALCLPQSACAMAGRTVLTELGPDEGAVRMDDRNAILFDLGLGTFQVDVCIRTSDKETIEALRAQLGRSLFEAGNPLAGQMQRLSPHRVFVTQIGRMEVFQPIPPADGKSPEGPHTHLLPKLLQHRRTHAATAPIPDGLVPCAHIHPPHPMRDIMGQDKPFDHGDYAAFQGLLVAFGLPGLVRLKEQAMAALQAARDPDHLNPDDRFERACVEVARRQYGELDRINGDAR